VIGVTIDGLCVAYNGHRVVDGLSLEVPGGEWTTLIGPNGAGKTTIMRAVAGLVPYEGTIDLGDRDIAATSRRAIAQSVAYVPQRPFIPPAMTVADYTLMGRTPYIPYFGVESRRDLEAVGEVLDRLELQEFADRPLGSLSGGEVQRAVLARALAQQTGVLLLDEPTSALDIGHQQQVLELVDSLRKESKLTVITTMHDLTLAGQFAECLVLLDSGCSVASGPPAEVLNEDTIRRHYGASARVIDDGSGGLVVVPTRAKNAPGP
jgi:iron complex transport system ATP-binding protein